VFRKSPNEVYPEFLNIIQLSLGKFGRKGGTIKNDIKALILKQEVNRGLRSSGRNQPCSFRGDGPRLAFNQRSEVSLGTVIRLIRGEISDRDQIWDLEFPWSLELGIWSFSKAFATSVSTSAL
jgi:hypothetical protein